MPPLPRNSEIVLFPNMVYWRSLNAHWVLCERASGSGGGLRWNSANCLRSLIWRASPFSVSVGWTGIKTAKQQVLELVNRDLAEVRRQLRTSMKGLDRVRDHVANNREDILKIEVNIARIQDEFEAMSRKLERFLEKQGEKGESAEDGVESEVVPDDERRHIYD